MGFTTFFKMRIKMSSLVSFTIVLLLVLDLVDAGVRPSKGRCRGLKGKKKPGCKKHNRGRNYWIEAEEKPKYCNRVAEDIRKEAKAKRETCKSSKPFMGFYPCRA